MHNARAVLNFRIIYVRFLVLSVVCLRLGKKSAILLTVSGFVLAYLTLYTVAAYNVARHVYEYEGIVFWRSAPGGSFFPWPREPGAGLALEGAGGVFMRVKLNEIDSFIYRYLIKSWVLLGLTILLWVGVSLYILKLVRRARLVL